LNLANLWGKNWQYIQNTLDSKLHLIIQKKYQNLNLKIQKLAQEQTIKPEKHVTFYPRVVNNTDITFTNKEITLLQKGPKYNLHNKKRNWLSTLALEAETAINSLPHTEREYFRNKVAENLQQLKQHDRNVNRTARSEHNTIKHIITKIQNNKATVTSADKGNTIVILPMQQYQLKIHNFITNNNFQIAKTNPTKTYQNQVRKTINNSTRLIKPEHRWKYVNLNPAEPTIRALIKLHKIDQPIRPIVNWQHAQAYKLAKLLTEEIQLASLPYAHNNKKHLTADSRTETNSTNTHICFRIIGHYKHVLECPD